MRLFVCLSEYLSICYQVIHLPDYNQNHQGFTVSITKSRSKILLAKWMDDYHLEKKTDMIKMTFDFR